MSDPEKHSGKQGRPRSGPTTWRKGQPSPNPSGRPPLGTSLAETVRAYLSDPDPQERKPRLAVLLDRLYAMGAEGNIAGAKLLLERGYGRTPDTDEERDEGEGGPPAWLVFLEEHPEERERYVEWYRTHRASGNGGEPAGGLPRFHTWLSRPENTDVAERYRQHLRAEREAEPAEEAGVTEDRPAPERRDDERGEA